MGIHGMYPLVIKQFAKLNTKMRVDHDKPSHYCLILRASFHRHAEYSKGKQVNIVLNIRTRSLTTKDMDFSI